jgi:hypothetical protein
MFCDLKDYIQIMPTLGAVGRVSTLNLSTCSLTHGQSWRPSGCEHILDSQGWCQSSLTPSEHGPTRDRRLALASTGRVDGPMVAQPGWIAGDGAGRHWRNPSQPTRKPPSGSQRASGREHTSTGQGYCQSSLAQSEHCGGSEVLDDMKGCAQQISRLYHEVGNSATYLRPTYY